MKKTATILAALSGSMAIAGAGIAPAPMSKNPPPPPPPPMMVPCAGPISYNNIELLYANTDWGFGGSLDGGILRAEFSPMQNFYIAGSVAYTDLDPEGLVGDWDELWDFTLGVGAYFALTDNIHLAADVGWAYARYDELVDPGTSQGLVWDSESDSGWYARPHLRAKWGCLTAHVGGIYQDFGGNRDGDWALFVQLYYQLHPNWDVTAGYLNGDGDLEQWTVGGRYRY